VRRPTFCPPTAPPRPDSSRGSGSTARPRG
jgi:hypothetical protein